MMTCALMLCCFRVHKLVQVCCQTLAPFASRAELTLRIYRTPRYMQTGYDALDFISCTGTNFMVRAVAGQSAVLQPRRRRA
jgi:hypothetical protein